MSKIVSKKRARLAAALTALAALSSALGATRISPARVASAPALAKSSGGAGRNDFMRKVYEAQVKRAVGRGRLFFPGLREDQLETVESGYKMRRGAAGQCRLLLKQARSDLRRQQERGNRDALAVSGIGLRSAYRSVGLDRSAWLNAFQKHFKATKDSRAKLEGGEYGAEAVEMMVGVMRRFKAAPGFSRHTSGVAVDFKTTEGGVTLGADSNQNGRWKKTWFYKWLVKNAKRFRFRPLSTEAWHWEYEGSVR